MDYKPFLNRIDEAGATRDGVKAMVDCAAALMDELHDLLDPTPIVFLPCVIAALDRLKAICLIDAEDEEREKLQNAANALNSVLKAVVEVEFGKREDLL